MTKGNTQFGTYSTFGRQTRAFDHLPREALNDLGLATLRNVAAPEGIVLLCSESYRSGFREMAGTTFTALRSTKFLVLA